MADNDSLNIRAQPTVSSEILGTLAPSATGSEVVALSPDGCWAKVNSGETSGWVSLHFLIEEKEFGWPAQGDEPVQTVFAAQLCQDSMSDRAYGISVDILLPTGRGWDHYSGCCSLAR